jgi:hypothetical protein
MGGAASQASEPDNTQICKSAAEMCSNRTDPDCCCTLLLHGHEKGRSPCSEPASDLRCGLHVSG